MRSSRPEHEAYGRRAVALIAASVALVWATAFLGESVATRVPRGAGALPPYDLRSLGVLHGAASPWLVVGLLVAAVGTGLAGLWAGLAALARGWAPPPGRLVAGGLLAAGALLLVPPTSSDDVWSYTAYGRMAATGHDPYATVPNDLPGDPVVREAGEPWRDVASVYGPVATGVHALAARVAGPHPRTAGALVALLSAAAFAATALLLDRLAGWSTETRRRAALLWTLNPLLLLHLVAGAHVDAVLVAFGVAAVGVAAGRVGRRGYWRRWRGGAAGGAGPVPEAATGWPDGVGPRPAAAAAGAVSAPGSGRAFAAGALAAAGACVKLSGALTGAALAWTYRRSPRRLAALGAGAVLVTVPAYLLVGGWSALGPVRRASRFVSFGSPWRALSVPLDYVLGSGTSRTLVSALSLAAVALLCVLLARGLPSWPPSDPPSSSGASWGWAAFPTVAPPAVMAPARAVAVVTFAWLVGATYVLPWYDAWAWPFLALLPASRWDRWLAVRTALLTVAYLPGRIAPLPPLLGDLLAGTRLYVTPVILGLLAVTAVRWCRESA